jgi:predicted DNA-binding protein
MARMEERVNLRLSSQVLEPYTRLASLITQAGMPMTATHLIRTFVEEHVEQVEYVCTYAELMVAGDKEAASKVFGAVMDWNQSTIDVARVANDALLPPKLPG